jgi:curved DNA-binding protein CbpA
MPSDSDQLHQKCHTLTLPPQTSLNFLALAQLTLSTHHRQFYTLSLLHHPDKNRSDPNASLKFASISSAYQVLGNASKRAHYDRDNQIYNTPTNPQQHSHQHAHGQQHSHHTRHPHAPHHGSFSSSSASSHVGGRPASGLSKRRGPFRGPPPSFYAHGGYGAGGRNGADAGSTASSSSSSTSSAHSHSTDPAFISQNPIPHFNAHSHFRTQSHEDARRTQRRARAMEEERARRRAAVGIPVDVEQEEDAGGSVLVRFLVVGGILAGAGAVGNLLRNVGEVGGRKGKGREREREKEGG